LRLFVLQAHYRKPIDFTEDAIASATSGWQTLAEGLSFHDRYGQTWDPEMFCLGETAQDAFQCAMDDDLNTPMALAVLFDLAKELRRAGNLIVHEGQSDRSAETLAQYWYTLTTLAGILGLELGLEQRSASSLASASLGSSPVQTQEVAVVNPGLSDPAVEDLIAQRQAARNSKNWAEADRLRDELQNQGITLIDQPGVTRWHR
jgi:cysteinyl-tRNA synthetase